ncbi:MAG: class I SAM-dependent methyltransferase [Clostridia bacterium]|nr:class I SAM-dependent methyltransferase [Clostridia bacterium]
MSYDLFSCYYDLLIDDEDSEKRNKFYAELLNKNGADSGILLDLGCGTGTMSIYMASIGYDVIGVDASTGMLIKAREKIDDSGKSILLLNQDMTALDLYGTIDCAVCALDCLNHLPDKDAVSQALSGVSLFMNSGGIFVFDVNTVYKHREILADNAFIYDTDEVFCVWQNFLNADNSVDISLDFFEKTGELYSRETEFFTERAYSICELEDIVDKAGFDVLSINDDLSYDGLKENSERAVFTVKKR